MKHSNTQLIFVNLFREPRARFAFTPDEGINSSFVPDVPVWKTHEKKHISALRAPKFGCLYPSRKNLLENRYNLAIVTVTLLRYP